MNNKQIITGIDIGTTKIAVVIAEVISNENQINILLLYTGLNINKGNRVMKVINKLNLQEFILSYGDGIGDINISKLYREHKKSKCFI